MKVRERIAKLIDVKSIVTIVLVIVFCILALTSRITSSDFMTIFTVVIAFYFGTQTTKDEKTESEGK